MERLLSDTMARRIQLIHLLHSTREWLASEKIARILQCAQKTVMLDCQYLEARWSDYFTIETSKKFGIRLRKSPTHSIHDVYLIVIRESSPFSFLESIFFNPKLGNQDWEKQLFISSSSFYRLEKKISKVLQSRNNRMHKNPYYIYSSDERQVRMFFANYFLELYGIHQWPFPLSKEKIIAFARKISEKFQFNLTDHQIIYLSYVMAVTIIRERQGFLIQQRRDPLQTYHQMCQELKQFRQEIKEIITPLYVRLPDTWYEDFCYSLLGWEFVWDNPQEKQNVKQMATSLIDTVQKALKLTIAPDNHAQMVRLLMDIYTKHKIYPYQKYMIYDRFYYSSLTIQRQYIVFSAVLKKALKELERKTKFPWYSQYFKQILNDFLIYWRHLPQLIARLRRKVSVAVLSDLGCEHATFVSEYLQHHFHERIEVTAQEHSFFDFADRIHANTFDLYVANYTPKGIAGEKLAVIDDVPTIGNLDRLHQLINQHNAQFLQKIPYLKEDFD